MGRVLAFLKRRPTVALYLCILIYTLVVSYVAILKHYAFMSSAWDLGIYEQVLWSTVNTGRLFWYTPEIAINPSCNFLGIHFSPFLFLVLPIYAIFQTTETLLILQGFFLALGALPLYKLVVYESCSHKQALAFAVAYLAYPPIIAMAFFDFHIQVFLPLLFFYAFYYFKKEEWGKYFVFIVLSLTVIEFVPLVIGFFGLYGLWVNRYEIFYLIKRFDFKGCLSRRNLVFPVVTILLGLVWFKVARTITLGINPSAPPHPNWKVFGDPIHKPLEFIISVFADPIKTLGVIMTPIDQKSLYVFGLFSPLAFLSFLDLPSLMIGFPWFFVAFLSNYGPYYTPLGYHYIAFVAPFIFISAFYGSKRLPNIRHFFDFRKRFGGIFDKVTRSQPWRLLSPMFLVVIIATTYVTVLGIHFSIPSISEHDKVAEIFTRFVPPNASVLTQNDVFPHLSKRLYGFVGGAFERRLPSNLTFDYILVDTKTSWYTDSFKNLVNNLTRSGTFGVEYAADGVWLLKEGYRGQVTYPIENGAFFNIWNQGISGKLFDDISMTNDPIYQNITLSICDDFGFEAIEGSDTNDSLALVFEGWLYSPISGNYLFQLQSAESSKLYLNGEQIIRISNATNYQIENQTVRLSRDFHSIRIERIGSVAKHFSFPLLRLLWKPPWDNSIEEVQPYFLYPKVSPDVRSVYMNLDQTWDDKSPFVSIDDDHFTVLINCSLFVPSEGIYKFRLSADDCAFLCIDGEPILSLRDTSKPKTMEVYLSQGSHMIEIDYMESQDGAYLSVEWQAPGEPNFEDIPTKWLDFEM